MPGEFPEGGQPPRVLFVSWTPPSEGHIASDVVLWELLLHVLGASRFPSEEQRCLNSFCVLRVNAGYYPAPTPIALIPDRP